MATWIEGCATSRRTGIVTGETSLLMYARRERFDGTSPGILFFHGVNQPGYEVLTLFLYGATYLQQVINRGFIIVSSLWGSAANWGDSTSVTRAAEARTWLLANGAKNGPIGLWGASMGWFTAANYWDANPTHVGAAVGVVPVIDYAHFWEDSGGVGDPDAGIVARNPSTVLADRADTIPGRLIYSSEDEVVRPVDVTDHADMLGFDTEDIEQEGPETPTGHLSWLSPGYDQTAIVDLFSVLK